MNRVTVEKMVRCGPWCSRTATGIVGIVLISGFMVRFVVEGGEPKDRSFAPLRSFAEPNRCASVGGFEGAAEGLGVREPGVERDIDDLRASFEGQAMGGALQA